MTERPKILIVDDRQENLFTLEQTLRETGAEIIPALNGNEALMATLHHDFALAILDVHMPGMSGFELAEHLRSDEKTRTLPVIFLTATFSGEANAFKGYETGAVDYIIKPFNPVVLNGKVRVFLELAEYRKELEERVHERTTRLQHVNQVLRRIRSVNQLIVRESDPDELVRSACSLLVEARGFESAWIVVLDNEGHLANLAQAGQGEAFAQFTERLKAGKFPQCCKDVIGNPGAYEVNSGGQACTDSGLPSGDDKSQLMVASLSHGDKSSGFICLALPAGIAIDEEEESLLQEIAEDIAYALHNIEMQQKRDQAVMEMMKSELKFKTVFNSALDGIMVVNPGTGRIALSNNAMGDMLGYSPAEADQLSIQDLEFDTHGPRLEHIFPKAPDAEPNQIADLPIKRKDGSIFYADINTSSLEIDGTTNVMAIFRDVSQRKEYESRIRLQNAELIERMKQLRCMYDTAALLRQDRRVDELFQSVVELLPTGFLYPESTVARIWFDEREYLSTPFDDVARRCSADIVVDGETRGAIEVGISREPSDVIGLRFQEQERDLLNGIAHSVGEAIQGKEAEHFLQASREKYRSMVDNVGIGVCLVDNRMHVLEMNSQMRSWFPEIKLEDSPLCFEVFTAPSRESTCPSCPTSQTMEDGRVHEALLEMSRAGAVRNYRIISSPIFDSGGQIKGAIAMVDDMTERLSLEKQYRHAQKMESIGTLAGGIAHDFNNLLTVIQGYSEMMLAERPESDPGSPDLNVINSAAKRGAELVKRILTFSRQVESSFRPVQLNDEVQHVQKLLSRTLPKMIDIDLHLAEDLETISADAGQIEQGILNLAVNARDSMPGGGRLVLETKNVVLDEDYCRMHVHVSPGPHVCLAVSDTGYGMDEETVERIFEPFFTTKAPGEGTGLGLAMVFGIIKAHRGHVTCESEPGVGTTFKLYFPVSVETVEEDGQQEDSRLQTPGTETILVVDDEDRIRELARRILAQAGYTILEARNGREALEIYNKQRSDIALVILDLIMPHMGGPQCLEELLKLNPGIKVIISSGFAAQNQMKDLLATQARGVVKKPFQLSEFLRTVRRVLDES